MVIRTIALLVVPVIGILASCTLAPDHCITMSDCADGLTCNEGLCQADAPDDTTLSADADTSSVAADSSTTTSYVDAATTTATDAADASDAADGDANDAAAD